MEIIPCYDKLITCIHCKKEFLTTKIRKSTIQLLGTDSDFRPIYKSVNPLYYNVHVCEHCGIAFTDDFSKYFLPGKAEMLESRISNHWSPHSFIGERNLDQAIQSYQLAIICGEIKQEKHIVLAGLALRTAWLYREQQKLEWELRFLESARDEYIESYLLSDFSHSTMSELKVLFLVGELSRRIGDKATASKYFSKILEQQKTTNEVAIVRKTKEVWQTMREEKLNK